MDKQKKLKITKFELVWYILCGAVALWGLVYIILGLIADNLPLSSADNDLKNASNALASVFGLGFFGWGLIILPIAAVSAVIVLCIFAKRVDREFEKSQRRAARLAHIQSKEDTIDAPVNDNK